MINVEKVKSGLKLESVFREKGFQRKIQANEIIFMENDREDCLFYIAEGLVKLFMISPEGKEKTLYLVTSGQCFGEMAVFDGMDYCVNAQVLSDAVIYSMTHKDVKEVVESEPDVAWELLRIMANKMRLSVQQIKDISFYDISGRLASQIQIFSEQFGVKTERGILIQLALTHQELANLLGASRVTVTKTLNQFVEEGIIEIVNRKICIANMDKLFHYIR